MSDTDTPLGISVRPKEGLGFDIVVIDIGQELPLEIERRGEDSTSDAIALQLTEPQLHLVEPGTVGGRVVQPHTGMSSQPGLHRRGLVSREVIDNDMDLFASVASGGILDRAFGICPTIFVVGLRLRNEARRAWQMVRCASAWAGS